MQKIFFTLIIITIYLIFLISCTKDTGVNNGGTGGGGGGGGSTTGQAMFWIASDLGCGNIIVTCNGANKIISSYYSNGTPSCGTSGMATFELNPGTYNYTVSCTGLSGVGTVTVTAGNCSTIQLTGTGGGGGGGGGGCSTGWNANLVQVTVGQGVPGSCNYQVPVTFKNISSNTIDVYIGYELISGGYSCFHDVVSAGASPQTIYGCNTTGRVKWNARVYNFNTVCSCPW